jgi:hypothetical protein
MVRRPELTFTSSLRSIRLTTHLGLALAVAFGVCFLTGLLSHLIQHPPGWFWWPSRPVGLYRVTQGLHVATGLATIPLLAAKLWSVFPHLFRWPPVRDPVQAVERLSVAAPVASALFELFSGVLNIARWYGVMPFFFPAAHYWTAWLAIGALIAHVGVKLPLVRQALSRPAPEDPPRGGLSRRGLLAAVGAAAGVITLATVGQTVAPLSRVSLLAPRRPDSGPQGLPVNRSAVAADVVAAASDPAFRLEIMGPAGSARFSLADLAALPQHTARLPIACVEGWSANATWTGVRLRDLAERVGASVQLESYVESLQRGGRWRTSTVASPHLADPLTLIALRLNGEPLHLDHGYPCRLIAPNRPGVLQTKWVARITFREPS